MYLVPKFTGLNPDVNSARIIRLLISQNSMNWAMMGIK